MSPELLSGRSKTNTAECDVYSYGIIIYEIYSGKSPYEGETYTDVVRDICDPAIRKRPPIPTACPPKVREKKNEEERMRLDIFQYFDILKTDHTYTHIIYDNIGSKIDEELFASQS